MIEYTINRISTIIPVHLFGQAVDIFKLKKILKPYKIKILEDSAEAFGSFYKNNQLGTIGDIGVLSFNGNKIITTGSGGAIITNSRYVYKKAYHLANIAKIKNSILLSHDAIGFNYKMASINAALGMSQILKLKKFTKKKENYFMRIKKYLMKSILSY